ncbi:MAG: hypothetical protein KatS3mg124_0706 [Porticoccaceae bacterium]|nr:MAG: hypothetical protein KatS3mg124_0706 [Porticoccaceae bacterium]
MLPPVVDKILIALTSPLGIALLCDAAALASLLAARRRQAALLLALATGWLAFWSLPPVGTAAIGRLEATYPPRAPWELPRAQAIVVLGGGVSGTGLAAQPVDLGDAADRVWYAARLYRAGRAPLVVLSGGAAPGRLPEAVAMAALIRDLGVPDQALLLEEESRNTRGNARNTARLLAPLGIRRVLLVTSAWHMERALAHFRAAGLDPIPAPTDHQADLARFPYPWLPDVRALELSSRAFKELLGRLAP